MIKVLYKFIYNIKNKFKLLNNNKLKIKLISILISILVYIISYKTFKMIFTSSILAVFAFHTLSEIREYLNNKEKLSILNKFPTYIIALKAYTKIDNDIVIALRKTNVRGKLKKYIDKFNISIEKGISVYECFNKLKKEINIKKIDGFCNACQNCYLNGGDFTELLEKYAKILNTINLNKEKELQDSFSSKLVLILLIIINLYLMFGFVMPNPIYKDILLNTLFGKVIVNINVISYIFIYYYIKKINRMED